MLDENYTCTHEFKNTKNVDNFLSSIDKQILYDEDYVYVSYALW